MEQKNNSTRQILQKYLITFPSTKQPTVAIYLLIPHIFLKSDIFLFLIYTPAYGLNIKKTRLYLLLLVCNKINNFIM